MKTQDFKNNNNGQGSTTADRAFNNQNEKQKERGISNSGGQPSFTTSSKDSMHKPEKRKPVL
ncbi:MAG: hypothetical protein V4553_19625 [Bacteroidota bacterium]